AFDDHAEGDDVVDVVERGIARLHLSPDRIEVLRAAGHVRGESLIGEARAQRLADVGDVLVALALLLLYSGRDVFELFGIDVLDREILELALERLDAEAVRERRVYVERLASDPLLRLFAHELERSHVVDAIAELDEKDADVLRHRDDHLAEVL